MNPITRQIFLLAILFAFAFSISAQNWSVTDREEFIDSCMEESEESMGVQQSRHYCYCMLFKVMDVYDTPEEANNLTEAEALPMAEDCFESLNILVQVKSNWTYEEKENFINTCVDETEETLGVNDSRQYCYCMLFKIMGIYETAAEADKMAEDEILPMATDCLESQIWSIDEQQQFLGDCFDTGKEGLGEEGAVNYCNCMVQELAIMFPDPNDYNLSEDELSQVARKCLFRD